MGVVCFSSHFPSAIMIFFASLLFSLTCAAEVYYPPADLGLHHRVNMQANSRLILNPFSIFGNDRCEYRGNEGVCYGEVECLTLAGNYGNFCPGLQGLCCLFYRSCGQRTSQEISYFRNVQFPLKDRAPRDCGFQIVKRSDDYCGIRVTMEEADLPAKSGGTCDEAYFQVTGIRNDRIEPKCGRLTGRSYAYDISSVSEVFIHIKSPRYSTLSWNLQVRQVKCSEWDGEEDEDSFEGGSQGGSQIGTQGGSTTKKPSVVYPPTFPPPIVGPPAPPVQTTTKRPTTTSSPFGGFGGGGFGGGSNQYAKCGQRGPTFNQGSRGSSRRLAVEGPLGPEMVATVARRRKIPKNRRKRPTMISDRVTTKNEKIPGAVRPADEPVQGSVGSGAVINTFEWGVPSLNDSLFADFMGNRTVLSTRITFGTVAGLRELPWQIAMTINGKFHCGASLISEYHVLTAAHCVVSYKNNPSIIDLSLGDWDLSTTNDGRNLKAKVSRVTVHPSYSRSTLQNDLAVLKLTQKVTFTERIRPICLPTTDINLEGERAIVSGWGRNEAKKLQSQLHRLEATVIRNAECDTRWNSNGAARGFIVNSMMCMDSTTGDSCNGDSGGPSVYEYPSGSGNYVQVGVVSFGSGSCTDANLPGVYTRVTQYRQWIQQQMY